MNITHIARPNTTVVRDAAAPAATYRLDDDGTNAATFNQVHLPTIAPAYTRATYTLTATTQTLVALPASMVAAPGRVTLVEGVPLVCGFTVNSVPSAGTIPEFYVGLYNFGGSGSVLVNAAVGKDTGTTTGEIKAQSGTYPPSVAQFGSSYFGELIGAKIGIQCTLASGSLTAKLFVNGTLLGTSTGIATNGGMLALMQVIDGSGAGVIDIECVPAAAALAVGYGTFDTGAVDMTGVTI